MAGAELADGVDRGDGSELAAEVGELLFALVNLARSVGVDPETALRIKAASFRRSVETRG